MFTALLVIDVIVSLGLIGLILLQHGKGADVGAAFGSGASQTVFGSQGSGSFLTRSTAVLAIIFFIVSLALAYLSGQGPRSKSVVDTVAPPQTLPQKPFSMTPAQPAPADVPTPPSRIAPGAAGGAQTETGPSGTAQPEKRPADVPTP